MALDLQGYRVFLASPGGLEPERELFYRTAFEVNEIEAEACGRTLIPVGWERGTVGWGRPQSRLNARLKSCDFVVLMLADRWGSPTSAEDNGFSSGTEEEYRLARELRVSDDAPMRDILVLFRGIPERQLADPGEQLKKVLDFKDALEREKSLFFATFDDERDLCRILRLHLHRWLRGEDDTSDALQSTNPPSRFPSTPSIEEPLGEPEPASALEEAQELARRGRQSKAEGRFAEAVSNSDEDLEAKFSYAKFLRRGGRLTHALTVSKEVIALARKQGAVRWEIRGLGNLGVTQRRIGSLESSRRSLSEAVALACEDAEQRGIFAYLENNLGLTLRQSGNIGAARSHHGEALRIYQDLEDGEGLAYAHVNLSYVVRDQGDLAGARTHAQAAIETPAASERCLAMAHCNLGLIAEDEEALEQAKACFTTALEMNTELGNDFGQAMNYAHLARVKLECGEEREALLDAGQALNLNQWSGNSEGIAMSLRVLGKIDLRQKKYRTAESRLKDARDIYETLGDRVALGLTLLDIAVLMALTERPEEAENAVTLARESAEETEHVGLRKGLAEAEREIGNLTAKSREALGGH